MIWKLPQPDDRNPRAARPVRAAPLPMGSPTRKSEQPSRPRARSGEVVLVVDDEEMVRGVARVIFERAGFEVLLAVDGQEALDVFEQERRRISLVLLDMTMPRMGGSLTFRGLRQMRPDLPVILSSGYAEGDDIGHMLDQGGSQFLPKPYGPRDLLELTRRMLDERESSRSPRDWRSSEDDSDGESREHGAV